jgi:hypothetical protein
MTELKTKMDKLMRDMKNHNRHKFLYYWSKKWLEAPINQPSDTDDIFDIAFYGEIKTIYYVCNEAKKLNIGLEEFAKKNENITYAITLNNILVKGEYDNEVEETRQLCMKKTFGTNASYVRVKFDMDIWNEESIEAYNTHRYSRCWNKGKCRDTNYIIDEKKEKRCKCGCVMELKYFKGRKGNYVKSCIICRNVRKERYRRDTNIKKIKDYISSLEAEK